ncbi:MAG: trehalose-phosphatase [Chitinophagaceae bacterium]
MGRRLIIVSYLLPVTVDTHNGIVQLPEHFLTSFVNSRVEKTTNEEFSDVLWMGLPVCDIRTWNTAINLTRKTTITYLPIFIPGTEHKSRQVPGFSPQSMGSPYAIEAAGNFGEDEYKGYLKTNRLFANTIRKYLRLTDIIWIYDYELLLLPALIRTEMPDSHIALLLSNSLDVVDFADRLADENLKGLLKGMLGADLVGFTYHDAAANFFKSILKKFGIPNDGSVIQYVNRLVMVKCFHADQQKAGSFMKDLIQVKKMQQTFHIKFLDEYSRIALLDAYRNSRKRLILLDYDGTLVSFYPDPELAIPGANLLHLLSDLGTKSGNDVYVISGRSSTWLQTYFGVLPLNLIAEHGARYKWKNEEWTTTLNTSNDWKEEVWDIMNEYVRICPNSLIEEKDFSIVWHYRKATNDAGGLNANALIVELDDFIQGKDLEVLPGNKIVEVRQQGINKGSFLKKVIDRADYDFTFAVGDDRTDEDMFQALINRQNTFTVKVGPEASYAKYNLHTPRMVISLLEALNHLG